MGFIKAVYNFVMGLIGLLVLGVLAYVFLITKWAEYQEEQYAEERQELIDSFARESRKRGLGDLAELRQDYLDRCPADDILVLEGDAAEICVAFADTLMAQTRKREMALSDHIQLGYELCALEVDREGDDPEEYCDREDVLDETLRDALGAALCSFDRAWVFDPHYESSFTKRGHAVYADHYLKVDCATGLFSDSYYEGFFDAAPEDEEWPEVLDHVYEALESEDRDRLIALLDAHEFGEDEHTDQWMLNLFLEDRFLALIPEVLDRNGGKVNYDADYYDQPLSRAIDDESPGAALLMLDAGADPLRPHSYGDTPIVAAATNGMLDVVKALVARGADVNGVVGSESLNFGEPLRWSAWNGHEDTALWLLENGATIAPDDPSRYPMWSADSLLDMAVVGGGLRVVRILIESGAKSEDPLRLFQGATEGGNPDVVALLFDRGYELPDVEHHDRIYDAVTDLVKEEGRGRIEDGVRIFEILLERGLDMSMLSDSGWHYGHQAVIHYAPGTVIPDGSGEREALVRAQRLRFVKRVIDEVLAAGIDIDQRYETETMLMEAADRGNAELVRYLLDRGADATLRNGDGQSALDIAVREGRRLTAFWDDDEALRNRFSAVIETLGGSPDMLDMKEEPASAS